MSSKSQPNKRVARDDAAVTFDGVGLCYPMRRGLFNGHVRHLFGRTSDNDYWALRNVSFQISSGGVLGVIGSNGSGKSTMGRIIAGVYTPDEGRVFVRGQVSMLAAGTGFVKDLTGRENILINGAYLGYNARAMRRKIDEIDEFADIGKFIDQPVKTYSSGMRSRLGFAIATSLNPDILIVDEVLSAGDAAFKKKAKKRLLELVERARAVIVIAHRMGFLKSICTEVMWINDGRVEMQGKPKTVIRAYQNRDKLTDRERAEDNED